MRVCKFSVLRLSTVARCQGVAHLQALDPVPQVFPGARLPTDGVVVDGASYVDESMLTGEPGENHVLSAALSASLCRSCSLGPGPALTSRLRPPLHVPWREQSLCTRWWTMQ